MTMEIANGSANGAAHHDEEHSGVRVERVLSRPRVDPLDEVDWEVRDASIGPEDAPVFQQKGVEFPRSWSANATNIVSQKYFRGRLGSPERERSVREMIGRVTGTLRAWGLADGYLTTKEDAEAFEFELKAILVGQIAAFNSPVWFNVGFEPQPQCSACFILSAEDTMESILAWNTKEGRIFCGGSGSGINLSRIRSSKETLSKGGLASGPVSFMRGADAWAGSIKSGGKTRRAAKMIVLDVDHPDVLDFIRCKVREEEKAAALAAAGFDVGLNSDAFSLLQYQNANNSVRVTDEFMCRVERGEDWELTARVDGKVVDRMPARELFGQIADAAWRCADPGIQYDTTINAWHTCPASGRINASNPCVEYMHLDDSACNLASVNLLRFRRADGTFDVPLFEHVVDVMILAQEIIVGRSSYPTEEIGRNARAFRQLGLGFANLGALVMAQGHAYDSEEARRIAANVSSLMTGRAYAMSGRIAQTMGPYARYAENAEAHLSVIERHRAAAYSWAERSWRRGAVPTEAADTLERRSCKVWDEALELGRRHGFRNAQATVVAPTGTISFLMDCDTTGIEPAYSLVMDKQLVGGGTISTVNRTVGAALNVLGYDDRSQAQIYDHLRRTGSVADAPGLLVEHLDVFDVASGPRSISAQGHLLMMAAVQPFVSGAISKTVNLPASATVEDVADVYMQGWKLGLKAIAIYRDGSKGVQILAAASAKQPEKPPAPVRRKLPSERPALNHKFRIGDHEGYITAGEYEDGTLGEIFLNGVGKEGSTLRGMMNAFATVFSISLQYGVPLAMLARKFSYMSFEPAGKTGSRQVPFAKSLPDYIARWLAARYGDEDLRQELGVRPSEDEPTSAAPPILEETRERRTAHSGETCPRCGGMMRRTGSCHTCTVCGDNTGCG